MDKKELKTELQGFFDKLKALEERARKLKNQNLADIAASAHGKVKQLIDHPDTELMADTRKDPALKPDGTLRTDRPFDPKTPVNRDEAISRMRDAGDANPESTARSRWPYLFGSAPQRDPNDPNLYGTVR